MKGVLHVYCVCCIPVEQEMPISSWTILVPGVDYLNKRKLEYTPVMPLLHIVSACKLSQGLVLVRAVTAAFSG